MIAAPLLMALIALALVACGSWTFMTTLLLGFWGLPDDAEAGGGLMVAIIQLAIASGATVGGVMFDFSGYQTTFELSAALLCMAALLAWSASHVSHRARHCSTA
ncbi:hypothetical protein PspS35_15760 [Pseudomonas sp. S35]|nr:hypothetical protein PspS35_15760 [Pseudomonas sp. S35]